MKKASLQLSINAIVIIILAITLLGLGLTFIRQFLGAGSEQLEGILKGVDLKDRATKNRPLTFPRDITIESGETKTIEVGFYCDQASTCGNPGEGISGARPFLKENPSEGCKGNGIVPGGTDRAVIYLPVASQSTENIASTGGIKFTAVPTDIDSHSDVGYIVTLTNIPKTGTTQYYSGEFICNLQIIDADDTNGDKVSGATPYESEQIFITLG